MVQEQIALLRQLQHLVLIRDEESKIGAREKAEELSERMDRLVEGLDDEAMSLYRRLVQSSRIFMSPLSRGNCSACGMRIPTSVLQHVLARDRFVACGGCGRVLYVPEVKATGLRSTGETSAKFLLSRFSEEGLMVPRLKAKTPEEAITELVGVLSQAKVVSDGASVVRAALEREKILTTAVGAGLAFPHMRGVEEGVLTFAAGISPEGIPWGGELVRLVFFTVMPVVASPFYLKLLAALVKAFEDGERLPFLLGCEDPKTLWKELNKATRVVIRNL